MHRKCTWRHATMIHQGKRRKKAGCGKVHSSTCECGSAHRVQNDRTANWFPVEDRISWPISSWVRPKRSLTRSWLEWRSESVSNTSKDFRSRCCKWFAAMGPCRRDISPDEGCARRAHWSEAHRDTHRFWYSKFEPGLEWYSSPTSPGRISRGRRFRSLPVCIANKLLSLFLC